MKYRLELAQTVIEVATVEIEADSQEEAEARAIEHAYDVGVVWEFEDVTDGVIEVVSVEKAVGHD